MAIRKIKRAKPYVVFWKLPYTGKVKCKAFLTKEEAEKYDAFISYRLKYEKESFLVEDSEPKEASLTLEAACDAYLEASGAYKNEKILSWRMDGLKIPLELFGNKPISQITAANLQEVMLKHLTKKATTAGGKRLTNRVIKPVTARNRMKTLITILNWAKKKGMLETVPTLPDLPQEFYKHVVPPSESELKRILEVAPEHLQRVILIGARCGVRVGPSEMFKLQWEHVDFERGVLRVQAAEKNKKEPWREVPIQRDILDLFRKWHESDMADGKKFIIHYNGKDGVDSIRHCWNTTKKKAGITRELTPYSLRHKFATDLLAAGTDPGTVAKLMGHTSTDMIFEHYQHVMTKQKVQAIENLPTLGMGLKSHEKAPEPVIPIEKQCAPQKTWVNSSASQRFVCRGVRSSGMYKRYVQASSDEKRSAKTMANRLK